MKSENSYLVWAHPRSDSLTAQVVEEIQGQAAINGIKMKTLDLYRSNFDPVLNVEDEPDWGNPQKQYSSEVHRLFDDVENADTLFLVFPVWWFSIPAILKGYLDRVMNHGLAYGEGKSLAATKVRWIALVGGSEERFLRHGHDKHMTSFMNESMGYLGIKDSQVTFLYNTLGVEEDIGDSTQHFKQLFRQARDVVDALN
ncbi:NAD(P)H-dependent oxidoreductase [Salmonella enterica subsp. enterica serovar Choleraesuis]|nr:NAD(P)H-dependent oxidoreductase [Salmonella enterica subsp. enterica serovar Choleraesuis]